MLGFVCGPVQLVYDPLKLFDYVLPNLWKGPKDLKVSIGLQHARNTRSARGFLFWTL